MNIETIIKNILPFDTKVKIVKTEDPESYGIFDLYDNMKHLCNIKIIHLSRETGQMRILKTAIFFWKKAIGYFGEVSRTSEKINIKNLTSKVKDFMNYALDRGFLEIGDYGLDSTEILRVDNIYILNKIPNSIKKERTHTEIFNLLRIANKLRKRNSFYVIKIFDDQILVIKINKKYPFAITNTYKLNLKEKQLNIEVL